MTDLDALSRLTHAAHCVIGHNLLRHDLRVWRKTVPAHPLLRLPVIDPLAWGMDLAFVALGATKPTPARALGIYRRLLPRWACSSTLADPTLAQTSAQRWALAYTVTWLRVAGPNSILPPWVRLEP
ncbi:MAG: hypothetical protein KGS61_05555 [Verrucomicrobia bacterium]|nr:hypothetical protein [Verrucomicrobiota bacterium]